MNVNKPSVRKDELSESTQATVASRILHALTVRLGTVSRVSIAKQSERETTSYSEFEAQRRLKSEDEETRHRAFLNAWRVV